MTYYDKLIAAWNNPTQPPPGVMGTGLTSGMTTDQKITAVNSWTVVGPAIPMIIKTYTVYNLIYILEFNGLTAANQQIVRDMISMGEVDASPGTNIRTRMTQIFPNGTATFTNLANLAKTYDSPQVPWYSAPNGGALNGLVSLSDTEAAGLN